MLNFFPRLVQNQFSCIRVVVTFISEFITSRIVIYIKLFACISIEIPLEIETLILICHHNLILRSML